MTLNKKTHASSGHAGEGTNSVISTGVGLRKSGERQAIPSAMHIGMWPMKIAKAAPEKKQGETIGKNYRGGARKLPYYLDAKLHCAVSISEVVGQIVDTKFASEIGSKFSTTLLVELFRELAPDVMSVDSTVAKSGRIRAIEILNENAMALLPTIWFSAIPTLDAIMEAIRSRERIINLFLGSQELEKTVEMVTKETGFPGWLTLQECERQLHQARKDNGCPLTSKAILKYKMKKGDDAANFYSKIIEVSQRLKRHYQDFGGEIPFEALNIKRIASRVKKEPLKYHMRSGINGYTYRVNSGGNLEFIPRSNKLKSERAQVVMLHGLQVVRGPDKCMYALGGSNAVTLVALGPYEQQYIEFKYTTELQRYGRKKGPTGERDDLLRTEETVGEDDEGHDIHSERRLS